MAWELNAALFCLLIVGLSPLGHCAALRGQGKPKPLNLLNGNRQGRLIFGQNGHEPAKSEVRPGKLIIGLNGSDPKDYSNIPEGLKSGNETLPEHDYQADQAVIGLSEPQQLQGSVYSFGVSSSPAVHQLLGMRPKVDCEEDAMMLRIHGGIGSFVYGLLIDRGSVPPLPLSRVPSECGLHVQKTRLGLSFVIPYDGCYVAREMNAYILPLRLWGLPAKMYCPMLNLAPSPPSVSCYPKGMIVKTQLLAPVEDLWVKVENEWKPLLSASSECGFSLASLSGAVEITVPYKPCMEAKGGMYSFQVGAKNKFEVFCPSLVPSLPPATSSPVSSDQTGDTNTVAFIKPLSTDTSSIPAQRPTVWPLFGRPYQRPALRPPPVLYKPTWTDLRSVPTSTTQVSTTITSSAKPPKVGQMSSLPFAMTRDFFNLPEPQLTPAPITKVPDLIASPKKPKPAPVGHISTSRTKPSVQSSELFEESSNVPGKPILPAPGSVSSSPTAKTSSFLGKTTFYPAVHKRRPESVFTTERRPFPPPYLQKPVVLPTAAPSEPLEASRALGTSGFRYPAVPEMLSGSVFAQGVGPPQYPKRPAIFPTAAPSEPLEASRDLGTSGFRYPAVPEMLSGSVFAQGVGPPQYPKRPAIFPTAAPSTDLEAFGGLKEADSSFQAAPQMSKPFGYSACCPTTALYSSCCPPLTSYHQHTHHHFNVPYPSFNPATGSARKSASSPAGVHYGSATQHVTMQTVNGKSRSEALPLYEEIQQGASKSLASSSSPLSDGPTKSSKLKLFIPQSKRPWSGRVPQLPSSQYESTTATPLAHDYEPVTGFPPNLNQSGLAYSKLVQRNQNVGPAFEEKHLPSLPTSEQTIPRPFILLPHERTSRLNYGHPANPFSTYSEAKVPPVVEEPYSFSSKSELPQQDPKLLELNPGLSENVLDSEPPVHLKSNSQVQEQVHGTHERLPYSSDYVTRLQALTVPFNKHWVPVVHPKHGEQAKSFVHHP